MKAIHKNRLLKLAAHLESGKLAHKVFDFSIIDSNRLGDGCGTAGCAMGELPAVFPKVFSFNRPVGIGNLLMGEFLGIDREEQTHLFVPNNQDVSSYGGIQLGSNATAEQVAGNIREFVKVKEGK